MKSGSYVPERGDLVWLNFTPQAGHKQRGKRLAFVLSPKMYNKKTSLAIFLPITSKVKGYPFEVALPLAGEIQGVILSDQIKNLDFKAREVTFICKVPSEVVEKVQRNALALIG